MLDGINQSSEAFDSVSRNEMDLVSDSLGNIPRAIKSIDKMAPSFVLPYRWERNYLRCIKEALKNTQKKCLSVLTDRH